MSRILATCCLLVLVLFVNQSIGGKNPVVETVNNHRIFDYRNSSEEIAIDKLVFSFQMMTDAVFDMDTALVWCPAA